MAARASSKMVACATRVSVAGEFAMATASTEAVFPRNPETLEERFERLADEWQSAVAHFSSSSKRDNHPIYKELIAIGPPIIPLLLRDLGTTQRHWFTALRTITGANPVPQEDAGNIRKMIESWLNWGKSQGYRW